MARLMSDMKMGFYPTPYESLRRISMWIGKSPDDSKDNTHYLDPCCGDGKALRYISTWRNTTWGIELDVERAGAAGRELDTVVQGSIFDARINPLGCMGLLWLNPPYTVDDGERAEMKFLKHSIKWLCTDGVLVFIIPEHILYSGKNKEWIGQHFYDITVVRLHRDDYPKFRQVVLFGKKREERVEDGADIPSPDRLRHIEDVDAREYIIPHTDGPKIFQGSDAVTEEDIRKNRPRLYEEIKRIIGRREEIKTLSPLLLLRKGHLVALLTAGVLDGKVFNPDGSFILVKGFSERVHDKRVEGDAEIIRDTYAVGIRVLGKEGWYDIT